MTHVEKSNYICDQIHRFMASTGVVMKEFRRDGRVLRLNQKVRIQGKLGQVLAMAPANDKVYVWLEMKLPRGIVFHKGLEIPVKC